MKGDYEGLQLRSQHFLFELQRVVVHQSPSNKYST